jgi:hypothetical protein
MHGHRTRKQIQALRERGQRMARVRWENDRARRDAWQPARERELAEIEVRNLPRNQGDAVATLQWTDHRTGQVRRWTLRIGDRADRFTVHAPSGESTAKSHGLTWIFNKLRSRILS